MKPLFISAAIGLGLLSVSCEYNKGTHGILAAEPMDVANMSAYRVDTSTTLEGKSDGIYILIPTSYTSAVAWQISPTKYDEAVRDALSKSPHTPRPVALANVRIKQCIDAPYGILFGSRSVEVSGNPIYKK